MSRKAQVFKKGQNMDEPDDTLPRRLVRWGLYPASWALVLAGCHRIIAWGQDPKSVWLQTSAVLVLVYFALEILLPYRDRWRMTWASFLADLRFILVNGAATAAVSTALGWLAITTAGRTDGIASAWPIWGQVLASLLIFEAINYHLHRAMHDLPGPVGRFLWRSHAAHHLPPRLYLLMHAVFHPINGVIIQALALVLPIWAMGYGPQAVAIFFMINGLHGLISHFNVDVRMGWLNYVFIGPETHRYHHSADPAEARNFGNTLAIFDLVFGTFVYHPGVPPVTLGVAASARMPPYDRILAVLALPFSRRAG
jgi:sterol desaturase/sphingolipid hydroxylase (fatty acid hydroxylase superfamily)